MVTLKKLTLAPFFLIAFAFLIYQLAPLFKSTGLIFSLSLDTLIQLLTIVSLIALSSFLFVLFVSLALDFKLVLPVAICAAILPIIFLDQTVAIISAVIILISLLVSFLSLENNLKTYLTFQPNTLFGPSVRHLSSFLILIIAISYFLTISKDINQQGFQIPDSLIDTALKFTPQSQAGESQLELSLVNDLIKQTVKDQIQTLIKPYLNFIPAILALLLFLTFQSLASIINLLIYPLLWITFKLLEKTGYIKFTTEMRPVKKMVV